MSARCCAGAFRSRGRVRARSLFSARAALLMDSFQGPACLPLATRWRRPPTRRSVHRRWSIALSPALSPRGRGRVRARSLFSARAALLMDSFQGPACLPLATRWRRPPTRRSVHRRWSIALSPALSPRGSGLSCSRSLWPVRGSLLGSCSGLLRFLSDAVAPSAPGSACRFDRRLWRFSPGVLVLGSGALRALIFRRALCLFSPHVRGLIAVLSRSFFGPCDAPGPRVG